ncbi:MAG: mannitol dehydrogenase family protein, partial [Nocardioidaceae bacterium]
LGNFFRAHQAWYTDQAPDAHHWGIAAFTGRRAAVADALGPQDGLYTLVTRAADDDRREIIGSISATHRATDHAAWLGYLTSPEVAVLTLTVTEAGYLRDRQGRLDTSNEQVRRDAATLQVEPYAPVSSVPARLLAGLLARERAGLGPVALVPCDNLPGNGEVIADAVRTMAALVDPALTTVVDRMASFVTTVVDRITPATTPADVDAVRNATGLDDAVPVVTEPFSEWILSGDFPAGRPQWEYAGAQVVADVTPFERRKLSLLNGAHSLLAYGASIRGHATVAEAVADEVCRGWLEQWWDEAARHLDLPAEDIAAYRTALLDRFGSPRIRHALSQIAADGSQKLPVRILPTLRAELDAGRLPAGATRAVAAWVCHLRGQGAPLTDPQADAASAAAAGPLTDAVPRVLALLDERPFDADVHAMIVAHAEELAQT